ncbi:unnamed protein product [Paramecium primaurelia]|uniref:Uncharacterized protein n=1 Tax=Paramecium primaurelia TaxID=5886 RepID=A0A8S1PJE1_PARPR|nr:unnamed protein product [Paramecium primaurelia]
MNQFTQIIKNKKIQLQKQRSKQHKQRVFKFRRIRFSNELKQQSVINGFFANFINTLNCYKKKYLFFPGLDTLIKKQQSNLLSNQKYINDQKLKYQLKLFILLKQSSLFLVENWAQSFFLFQSSKQRGKTIFIKKYLSMINMWFKSDISKKGQIILIMAPNSQSGAEDSKCAWIVKQKSRLKHMGIVCVLQIAISSLFNQGESQLNYYIIQMNHFQIKEYQIQIYLKDYSYFSLICITVKRKYYLINAKTLQIIQHIRELYRDDQFKNYEQPISYLFK